MAFITRNASITLLVVLVASLVFLIGSTVYYQVQLTNINQKHDEQISTLKDLETKAQKITQEVNQATRERELRIARGGKFASTYSQLKSEAETTEARRDRFLQEKADLEAAISQSQRDFIAAKAQNEAFEKANAALLAQENQLIQEKARKENLLRSLSSELRSLREQLEKLKKSV